MKPNRLYVACSLALVLALLSFQLARATSPLAIAPLGGPDAAFRDKFKKAMEKPQKGELEKIVKGDTTNAAAWIVKANEILVVRPDDPELGPFLTELSSAWKASMKSNFPDLVRDYLTKLEGENKKERPGLRERFDKALADFEGNAQNKDPLIYAQTADELEVLGFAFEQIGDHYFASETWIAYSGCYDDSLRTQGADPKRALTGLEHALAERAKIELADARKDEVEKRKAALASKAPKEGGEKAPSGPGDGPTEAGGPVAVPLSFEMLTAYEAFQRPNYDLDEFYNIWRGVILKKAGSSSGLELLEEGPAFHRLGAADVRVDMDGDGKADGASDLKLTLTGSVMPLKLTLGKGTSARPWGCFFVTAGQQEMYQGVQLNMAPNENELVLFMLSAASLVGTLDGQPIRILDETMDGVYGTEPQSFGFAGTAQGSYQPYLDAFVVGASKRARPWSEIAEVNGKWWKFETGVRGGTIHATPMRTDTGTLKLEFKGPVQPTYVIVHGTGPLKGSWYDLVEGGAKGVQVPVGKYSLAYGELRKGKKKQMQKCVILPARNAGTYDVTKDGTTVITLGAPFGFDFVTKPEEGKLTVTGRSVVVTGSAGERYERTWQCVPKVEASWRKQGAKKVEKSFKMSVPASNDIIQKLGWDAMWFPLDLEMHDIKGDAEVQLVDKKHDLFGKVESEWK